MNRYLRRGSLSRGCALLTLCATLPLSVPAVALEGPDVDHAKRARIGYDLQDWTTAVREYRAAYEAEPKPEYLFGLAQALRQSRDYAAAIYTFRAFRRLDGISAEQASAAELLIAKCEAEAAKAEVEAERRKSPAAASERLGSADPSASALAPPSAVSEPSPVPQLPPAAAEPTSAPPSAFYEDLLGDGLCIAGLAAVGVGAGLLLGGNAAMNDAAGAPTEADARAAIDSAHGRQVAGAVLLPLGGVLLAGAAWRWLSVVGDTPRELEHVSVGPDYVGYRGEF